MPDDLNKMRLHSQASLDDCVLKPNRIDIWHYPLDKNLLNPASTLNAEETLRANRFYFPRHQRRFTHAHAVLRNILARYVHQSADELTFTTGLYGKPALVNSVSLEFNLSHSGEAALLAVGQGESLGIDLEFFADRPYHGIAETLFSPVEIQALRQAPSTLVPLVFFNIWAQKEAFIKANGQGLNYPTKKFSVPVLATGPTLIDDSLHQTTWAMRSFMPQAGCSAALCAAPICDEIRYTLLNHDALLTLLRT